MSTRNATVTGFFLRKRLTRHIVLRLWDLICTVVSGRDMAATWQPTVCHICQAPVETRARFCGVCGAAQQAGGPLVTQGKRAMRQTEEIHLSQIVPARQTEEIQRLGWVSTQRLYPVRLGTLRPIQQHAAQQHAWLYGQLRVQYPHQAEALIAAAGTQGHARLLDWLIAAGNTQLVARYRTWHPAKEEHSHATKE